MIEVEIWTIARTQDGNAVFLKPLDTNLAIPIFIGFSEANAILTGLGERPVPRPLTHDLMLAIIQNAGLTLERVEIYDIQDNTFYAQLVLSYRNSDMPQSSGDTLFLDSEIEDMHGSTLILDSRPSDAIALAVRRKCPILVSELVLDQAGIPVQQIIEEAADAKTGPSRRRSRREELQTELEGAVAAEEYERAAEIRDMLTALDREASNNKLS